jgi:hypothetical protein
MFAVNIHENGVLTNTHGFAIITINGKKGHFDLYYKH